MKRTARSLWSGTLKEGSGTLSAPGLVLNKTPYSFTTRFGDEPGTNPEELLAAAHAGCFGMAFSLILANAGYKPTTIETTATVNFENVGGSWTITSVHLDVRAKVPGIDDAKFQPLANSAKLNCPISRALRPDITMAATLES